MNLAFELGKLIHSAAGMKAAAMSAPTPDLAKAFIANLESLAAAAAQLGATDVAKMIYTYAQQAYKHVTDLVKEQDAENITREALSTMGNPTHAINPMGEQLASSIKWSDKLRGKFENIDPNAKHKMLRLDKVKGEDIYVPDEINGQRLRDSIAIMKADGDLSQMRVDIIDGKIKKGSKEYAEYEALEKSFNRMVYGQDERPNASKYDKTKSAAENKRLQEEARAKLDAGKERIIEANREFDAWRAAQQPQQPPAKEAAAKGKKTVGAVESKERALDNMASMDAKSDEQKNALPKAVTDAAAEEQKQALRGASEAHANSARQRLDDWGDDVTPSQQQQKQAESSLLVNDDKSLPSNSNSPLPAGAPTLAGPTAGPRRASAAAR